MSIHKTIFLSDLHLQASSLVIGKILLGLLNTLDETTDAVYILGDLFETWIGDDDDNVFHQTIIQAFKNVTKKGIPIYLLHGNRDFLIGKKFLSESGCQLLSDETKILLYHTPVLIMHGDTLCTQDHAYIKARKKLRNQLVQKIFLFLPLSIRQKIAAALREKSKQHTAQTSSHIMDVTQAEVERVMKKNGVYYLIHGHTHRPDIHHFSIDHSPALRIVLDAWHERGHILIWDELGHQTMLYLD